MTVQGHTGGYPGSYTFWYYLPEKDTYLTYNLNSAGSSLENLRTIQTEILTCLKNGTATEPQPAPAE